ncbi:protein FAR1-RELATED SEQUENCE 5-like [Asparagus officinalis]|uniref:protein FAR1-RELATED SEQUENCE 5-like n=1 Tax=Asparagus officinalis TaxID=4686 RepID=UPI00098E7CBB|nr:protein FAR1-RELATED SEQUENCE 5-like [Asparagus officinalis]
MQETNLTSVEFRMEETNSTSVSAPKPLMGMKFNSYEEAYNYYNSYALLMGFGIRKSMVNYSRKTREVVDRKFVCDKEGYKSNKDKMEIHLRRETRVGCKAMMRAGFIEEHTNHVLSSPDKAKMHRSHQQFHKTQRCKKLIDSLREEGMPPSTISHVINATNGREGELVTSQQCIDHIRTQRVNNIGHECISIIRYFQSATANDPEFYFVIEVDSSGQMRSVFWADGRSRASYLKFSDVIVFDVTYRTNKFSLPFAPFTGVNHHRQSTLLGCALLADEQEDTFVWLFQCEGYWVEMKEKFDINEEGEGWLQTIYKCRDHWVPCYLKDTFFAGMRSSQRSESINAFFDGYVNSQTQLHDFVTQYEKAVTHRRLSEAHEDFKSLNTKPVMLLGHPIEIQAGEMYTRNMFDVFHTEFKGFGTEFCEELRKGFGTEFCEELRKDGDIVEYKVCKFTDRGKWEVVTYEQSSQMQFRCTCALFETNGVVCRHILSLMMARQMDSLPDHYILHRWTIHARHRNIGVGNIIYGRNITSCEEKINLLKSWALRAKFNNALELAFASEEKMQNLDDVLTKFIEPLQEEVGAHSSNQDQMVDTQISAHISNTKHIPQITVRDPDRAARTKGRPRNANRIQSGLEQAQEKKERKKRICSRCGELGHYRTSCKVNLQRRRADVVVSLGNGGGELISSEEKAAASKARDLVVSRADVVGGELISSEEKVADLGISSELISSEEKAADLVGIGNGFSHSLNAWSLGKLYFHAQVTDGKRVGRDSLVVPLTIKSLCGLHGEVKGTVTVLKFREM